MNIEKMREDFESRFPVPIYVFWCDESQRYMSRGNPLACLTYQGRWEGWQASRESLLIELPSILRADEQALGEKGIAHNGAVINCKKAIEAAGLKVKS